MVAEATEIQEQQRRLRDRMKDVNDRLMPVRSEVNYMRGLIERKAAALKAEEEYLRSPESADDPAASVWALLPSDRDPDEGLQALITQIRALRTTSLEDEAHSADDARLRAVLDEASSILRRDGSGIPTGDKQTLLKHLRDELALIMA